MRGTLETVIVTARPDGMPLFADWPREIYSDIEQAWSVQIADRTLHISQVELEVVDATLAGPIRFAIVADAARAEFQLEYFQREETWDYRFVLRGEQAIRIVHGDTALPAEEFFTENPPKIWFADGAMLEGDEYTPLKTVLPPYDRERIATWDWTGIDITKESQGIAKAADSVQAAVIRRLMQEDYQVLFDDDDAGEAADVVAITARWRSGTSYADRRRVLPLQILVEGTGWRSCRRPLCRLRPGPNEHSMDVVC